MATSNIFIVLLLIIKLSIAANILVGPTRTYTNPAAAIGVMKASDVMILDDGTYTSVFDVPDTLNGFVIKSASGNPYKCKIDGRGGVGSGYKLSYGKGIIHVRSPGTIQGIGFVNGGGGDGVSDGEAGVYAENFVAAGTLNLVNCSFDGNENGIFVPSWKASSPGQYVDLVVNNCIFSKNVGNGIVPDGQGHNVYIQGKSYKSINSIHFPSKYGNNQKTRSPVITISDQYNKHDQGRCLDIPSGGQLTVTGGVYTAVGPTAVSNFFSYASENTDSGVYVPTINGLTIVGARYNDAIWNAPSSITIAFQNIIQKWANVSPTPSFNCIGSVTGIVTSPPAGTTYVSIPSPNLPPWAL